MNRFLDNIEKYKFAIIGTIMVHIIVFFFSIFTTVKNVGFIPPPDIAVEIPLDDIEFEPEISELLDLDKEELPAQEIKNLAADENDKRDKSYEDYSTNPEDLSEESMLSAKELEAKYFEEAAEKNDRTNVASNMEEHKLNEKKSDKTNVTTGGKNAFAGEVMIKYSLGDRKSHSLHNPGYTCNSSGTVVIQIRVDKNGDVKEASFVSGLSSGATDCMIEKSIRSAKKSRFNYNGSTTIQTGTITYKFIVK
tara:strand:- start:604 stop:1353 length:750 start_codon:yes stop_codon:yes gene_type:complete